MKQSNDMKFWEDPKLFPLLNSLESKPFNLFHTLEDLLGENSISKIISYFLGSENSHGMGLAFSLNLVDDLIKGGKLPKSLRTDGTLSKISEVETVFNWATTKKRFVDIVAIFRDEDGKALLVLGFETKIWAGEQRDQVRDYQRALLDAFPDVLSRMIFLSPNGYLPSTADASSSCRCFPVSYVAFSKVIVRTAKSEKQSARFLSDLGEFMKTGFVKSISDDDEKQIKELWEKHPESLTHVVMHGKRVKSPRYFVTEILSAALSSDDLEDVAVFRWAYPIKVAVPYEYNFVLNDINAKLKKAGYTFQIFYMIYNQSKRPVDDHNWDVRLMLWPDRAEWKKAKAFADSYSKVSGIALSSKNQWLPWICLELGPTINFGKHSNRDAGKVVSIIRAFEKRTYSTLLKSF